jgi:hypothetical protein
VFGDGAYRPESAEGRRLVAHELTHVLQQGGGDARAGRLAVVPDGGALEEEAESADGAHAAGAARPGLQRKVVVSPAAAATQIESHLHTFCGANLSHSSSGELSEVGCGVVKADEACNCVCDVVDDASRLYTINVAKSTTASKPQKLWDGTRCRCPRHLSSPILHPWRIL